MSSFLSRQVWQKLGITSVEQLMNENFEFIEYTYFATMFGNDINVLEYYGVIKATKRYKESLNLKNEPNLSTNESKPYAVLQSEANGTQAIRKILSQITTPLSKAVEKWNNICGNLDWHTIYSSFKRSTSDTNLKWFQYRILCRILTTNEMITCIKER